MVMHASRAVVCDVTGYGIVDAMHKAANFIAWVERNMAAEWLGCVHPTSINLSYSGGSATVYMTFHLPGRPQEDDIMKRYYSDEKHHEIDTKRS